jgi:SWI/SNF-related matrix-associated actin-dependent regulator of chromatin subfamily A member 5
LTEEEIAEKEELSSLGFYDWTRKDFNAFLRGSEAYGKYVHRFVCFSSCPKVGFSQGVFSREAYELIAAEIGDKTEEDVRTYASVFWDRYDELDSE